MIPYILLSVLGFVVGAFGTLVGAGGGFLLMPVLVILYPDDPPELLTAISLAVVFLNALSGSVAYAKLRRIDYRAGLIFALAAIPGAIIGASATSYLPRRLFDMILGALLVIGALFLFFKKPTTQNKQLSSAKHTSHLVDSEGHEYQFSYNLGVGIAISLAVGFVSSLLGIGGGIIHVPSLVYLVNFPVAIATATSHFILAIVSFAGTCVHIHDGIFEHGGIRRTIALSLGVVIGAQIGAQLSHRISGHGIIRALSLALLFVGFRVLWQGAMQ